MPGLKLCCSRGLRSQYIHIHTTILLASIAGLIRGSRIVLAIPGYIDAHQRDLFIQGEVTHDSVRAPLAELQVILLWTAVVCVSPDFDDVVFHASHGLGEIIQSIDVFLSQLALVDSK